MARLMPVTGGMARSVLGSGAAAAVAAAAAAVDTLASFVSERPEVVGTARSELGSGVRAAVEEAALGVSETAGLSADVLSATRERKGCLSVYEDETDGEQRTHATFLRRRSACARPIVPHRQPNLRCWRSRLGGSALGGGCLGVPGGRDGIELRVDGRVNVDDGRR
ncbi:hypothetical protein DFH11DRAFT_1233294 [Phellopilus nigrolimitatus]|nr:hypothetical protein DFH11DRAFT_1233294 [Phellopilus nigrolimitatus]